jgi:hypothetical protein
MYSWRYLSVALMLHIVIEPNIYHYSKGNLLIMSNPVAWFSINFNVFYNDAFYYTDRCQKHMLIIYMWLKILAVTLLVIF